MSDTKESRRYETIDMQCTPDVVDSFHYRHNPLYRRPQFWDIDPVYQYSKASIPKDERGNPAKFASTDAALAAVRKILDGPIQGQH